MTLWLDCSASYASVPTAQNVADLKALGFVGAIIGVYPFTRAKADQQHHAFEAGGMRTREYQFPEALALPAAWPWHVDAELDTATVELLRAAMDAGADGPYSRKGFADGIAWDAKGEYPNSTLWDARYVHGDGAWCLIVEARDNGGDVKAAINAEMALTTAFKPYWGYERATITQFHNSITICDVNMDLNWMEDDDAMTPEQEARLAEVEKKTYQLGLIAWNQAVRTNALDVHQHKVEAVNGTSGPVAPQ